jgi:ubiquinone/menaquinone biosynthesis C-methylase UbiE
VPHVHGSDRHGDFDAWASTYDQSRLQRLFFDRVHDAVLRTVATELRGVATPVVCDVGCGTGRLLERLRAVLPDASLIGVDASAKMIEVAAAKPSLRGMQLLVARADALPLETASCDLVVSTISFHHWEDQAGGLRDVARVLRTDGRLLLVDAWARGLYAPLLRRFGRGHGVGLRSETELVGLLHGAALRPAAYARVGPPASPLGIVTAAPA